MRMLARGVPQAEVARRLEVSRQTTSTWEAKRQEDPQAWRRRSLGRPSRLEPAQRVKLPEMLVAGAVANGFATELWTLALVAMLIKKGFGFSYSTVQVWGMLRQFGFSNQRPTRVRTWAPVGQTPVLQYSFRWTSLSRIAGIIFWRFYFRLFRGSLFRRSLFRRQACALSGGTRTAICRSSAGRRG
ncbi:MAG: winged helix-turn-helix domain-containing protein [Burkholderiales bacterium]|nr:winged helix-turn-helix domain-containing protein [Burkholderiales bacterium]